ncbi:hypothetical protein ABT279_13270 [Amycolatopsis sp. NPDC000673]|uniref:hypothetical protein n=1 Tax=Amycolatopsis sp. NPDC000673 TaxID=3154267 RepID=UPI0033184592
MAYSAYGDRQGDRSPRLRRHVRSSPRLLLWLLLYLVLAYGALAAILALTGQLGAFLQWVGYPA